MTGQQKLLSLWLWLLLMVALCPGAQYAYSKRGGFFKSGKDKKSDSKEAPPSQSRGLSKNGLKWAGAAAAGMLGGTGTGYGLGFLGKPKYGSKSHHGHKTSSSEGDQRVYYQENQRYHNQSRWRAYVKSGAPAPMSNIFLTLGYALPLLIATWMRVI